MDIKQNPFSLYDFLGYVTPGAILLYGVIVVVAPASTGKTAIEYIPEILSFKNPEIYIPFVLAAYTTGHFLSFLSSITVERFSIWRYGYPSKYMLGFKHAGYFRVKEKKSRRHLLRIFVGAFLLPVTVLDLFLGDIWGFRDLYAGKLDKRLSTVLQNKMNLLLTEHSGLAKEMTKHYVKIPEFDFFRYGAHYALENAPHHIPPMQNYVALYGFLRTVTLISVFLFWGITWQICWQIYKSTPIAFPLWSIAIICIVPFFLYMAFVKFYRRYSLEVMMAVAVTVTKQSTQAKHPKSGRAKKTQRKGAA